MGVGRRRCVCKGWCDVSDAEQHVQAAQPGGLQVHNKDVVLYTTEVSSCAVRCAADREPRGGCSQSLCSSSAPALLPVCTDVPTELLVIWMYL